MGGYLPILSKLNSISDRKGRQKQECPGMKPCDKLSCTLSGTKMSRGVSTYTRRELETDGLFKPFSKKKVVHAKSEDCAHGRMGTSLMGCIIDPKRSSNIKSRFPWANGRMTDWFTKFQMRHSRGWDCPGHFYHLTEETNWVCRRIISAHPLLLTITNHTPHGNPRQSSNAFAHCCEKKDACFNRNKEYFCTLIYC